MSTRCQVICLMCAALTLPIVALAGPSPKVEAEIAILTFNCPNFSGRVTYHNQEESGTFTAQPVAKYLYKLILQVEAGHHEFVLSSPPSSDPGCYSDLSFTVIPGHTRHLTTVLGFRSAHRSACAVAGTLPVGSLSAALVIPRGSREPNTLNGGYRREPAADDIYYQTEVDGLAYYIEGVSPTLYHLRIKMDGFYGDIPIDLSSLGPITNPFCKGALIRNITIDDLKTAFPIYDVSE